jgi:hypothetical protein
MLMCSIRIICFVVLIHFLFPFLFEFSVISSLELYSLFSTLQPICLSSFLLHPLWYVLGTVGLDYTLTFLLFPSLSSPTLPYLKFKFTFSFFFCPSSAYRDLSLSASCCLVWKSPCATARHTICTFHLYLTDTL